ncbi:nitrite reductase small subunit NirD [Paenibacillus crassostreae]|uniref:Nitrite reductase n=1 Tax=Paenibacillus crassostreae TaxID=1763538 RepID=A0A167AJT9_9BACL|nr:nitrite reductase small subunit NirD [Paenibacillus crassostreae]AOZ92396.1 nitrite reductase [Paenibacillus crassostreae]OAB71111.1 nitrite reductase [Paenibacillus crassostreae]
MGKIQVGNITDIDILGSRTIQIDDIEVAVFRLSDGTVKAVENRCPHKGGKLSEGMVCGSSVHCPLHDWKIDLNSGEVHKPDDGCITTYLTEVDETNGSIYITL